jgi:predicted nucleic acid-binding protein
LGGGQSIPRQTPRAHRTHVDSCYARPILLNWDSDPDLLRAARRLFYSSRGETPLTLSEVVLGEVILTIGRDAQEGNVGLAKANDTSRRLIEALRRNQIQLCGLGSHSGEDPILVAAELRRSDSRLSLTDSLIAATALACDDCEVLFTNDRTLLACQPLLRLAREKSMGVTEAPG